MLIPPELQSCWHISQMPQVDPQFFLPKSKLFFKIKHRTFAIFLFELLKSDSTVRPSQEKRIEEAQKVIDSFYFYLCYGSNYHIHWNWIVHNSLNKLLIVIIFAASMSSLNLVCHQELSISIYFQIYNFWENFNIVAYRIPEGLLQELLVLITNGHSLAFPIEYNIYAFNVQSCHSIRLLLLVSLLLHQSSKIKLCVGGWYLSARKK